MLDWLDKKLNRFKGISFVVIMISVIVGYLISLSLALAPPVFIMQLAYDYSIEFSPIYKSLTLAFSLCLSYLCFAITLIIVVPALNWIMPLKLKAWRGRYYSLNIIPWYYHNALVQLVRYTVLDIVTPSPLNRLFYQMMGMKMGKNCIINTSNISDPCMIELGDNVTVGGSATIFAHYAQGGFIVIAPVKIGSGSTIGLKASIMGDVVIGDRVLVKPHDVVYPKTRLYRDDELQEAS